MNIDFIFTSFTIILFLLLNYLLRTLPGPRKGCLIIGLLQENVDRAGVTTGELLEKVNCKEYIIGNN